MRRILPLILALAASSGDVSHLNAEEAPSAQELHELREAIQQQAKQIELLAEQVGRLTRVVESQKAAEPAAKAPEAAPAPTATTSIEPAKPAPEAAAEAPKSEAAKAEAPKAEPVPKAEAVPGTKHVVSKGETLTSIAKHYNISIADLKNANKIDNERKMQIGQILSIPTAKTPEPTDKKENP